MFCFILLVYYLSGTTCSELLGRSRRAWIIDSFTIEEGHPGPFPYALGKIKIERNYLIYFDIFGEGVNENPKGVISISQDGTLFVHKPVDYEEKTILKLTFEARRQISNLIDTKLGVEIYIQDINDNPPRFNRDIYEISVKGKKTQGSNLLQLEAYDRDQKGTLNSTFHYGVKHVSPNNADTEFFVDDSGKLSFRGCLDYEVVKKFTILVEAQDHGEVVSLSSSTTVVLHIKGGNNHLPTITGQTGSGKVREEEAGSSPLRLHVADGDTPASPAWRARYFIQGDEGRHFKIETDPETNDGILTVVRPIDFEKGAQRNLTITVENEAPFSACKVVERTSAGLWTVDTSGGGGSHAGQPRSVNVSIEVEDANDPPAFSVSVKEAVLKENSPTGTWVEKVTAVDPDVTYSRSFVYKVGRDPAGWVTVDPRTGHITTIKSPDRESPHVVDGIYNVLLHAVDDGTPPMTGTSTLQILVSDQNDNVPQLTVGHLDVCASDSLTNITAFDRDDKPFGGPFTFELLGDVKRKWKLKPSYGYTAGLVKQPGVYPGHHVIKLKISDMQGGFGVYNLSVTICNCSETPTCKNQRGATTKAASHALGIMFASCFFLLILLLMAVVISCKKEFASLQADSFSGETLLTSNTEIPGKDCKVPDFAGHSPVEAWVKHKSSLKRPNGNNGDQHTMFSTKHMDKMVYENYLGYGRENVSRSQLNNSWNQGRLLSVKQDDVDTVNFLYTTDTSYVTEATVLALLHWRLSTLQEKEDDQDYQPHIYAEEGDLDDSFELEDIIFPEDDDFFKVLRNLGSKFHQLALICQPSNKI